MKHKILAGILACGLILFLYTEFHTDTEPKQLTDPQPVLQRSDSIVAPSQLVQSDPASGASNSMLTHLKARSRLKERLGSEGFRFGTGLNSGFESKAKLWEFVQTLEPADEDELLAMLLEQNSLSNRVQFHRMLTQCGGDKAAQVIIDTIKIQTGRFGNPAEDHNYYALHGCLNALGPISTRSEIARRFLREAADEEYWKLNRQHKATEYIEPHENRYLASDSIVALARGGHPEAMELINTMRQLEPHRAKLWAGALVDAVFEYEMALRGDSVRIGFIDEFSEFLAWGKTDTGKKWKQWSAEMRNIQD
jgi:hypothetical protein